MLKLRVLWTCIKQLDKIKAETKANQIILLLITAFFVLLEDEELVSSFITSRSEKHLVHQIKRSLMATKHYTDITINSVRKVKQLYEMYARHKLCCH